MTRKQHLQKLPLQKRLQAMENIRLYATHATFSKVLDRVSDAKSAIYGSFIFRDTKQGHNYWSDINRKYFAE